MWAAKALIVDERLAQRRYDNHDCRRMKPDNPEDLTKGPARRPSTTQLSASSATSDDGADRKELVGTPMIARTECFGRGMMPRRNAGDPRSIAGLELGRSSRRSTRSLPFFAVKPMQQRARSSRSVSRARTPTTLASLLGVTRRSSLQPVVIYGVPAAFAGGAAAARRSASGWRSAATAAASSG